MFMHDTLRQLPLSFRDITLPGGSDAASHEHEGNGAEKNRKLRKGAEREVVYAKYGETVARGQAFLPVPFTTTFKSRVACVEVRIQVRE